MNAKKNSKKNLKKTSTNATVECAADAALRHMPRFENLESRTLMSVAPSNFTATGVAPYQVNLAWTDRASDETGFIVERSTDNVTFRRIVSLAPNSQAFVDTAGLVGGTQYFYRVKALGPVTNSGWVRASGTTPLTETAPAAPSGFTATGVSISQIKLDWTDN